METYYDAPHDRYTVATYRAIGYSLTESSCFKELMMDPKHRYVS